MNNRLLYFQQNFFELLIALLIFTFLTSAYLAPGSIYLFEKRTDIVLSDGTDQALAPYLYHLMLERFKKNKLDFIYGATYSDKVNPPDGFAIWFSWIDKICVSLFSFIMPVEQFNAGISFLFLTLSGLSMFYLGKYLKWDRWISLGLGISWAYNAFTIARAKVHPGFDAIFFLPLIFIVFGIIKEKNSPLRNLTASILLLIVASVPQYFVIMTFFLIPFWFYYILYDSQNKLEVIKKSFNIIVPSFVLLLWTVLMPVSSSIKNNLKEIYPTTGESLTGVHPFMYQFAANPIDYLSGNIGVTLEDFNPVKEIINNKVFKDLSENNSNPHEHAVGIRWLLLLICLGPLYLIIAKKNFFSSSEKKLYFFFYGLAFFTFLLSLSPVFVGYNIGPSLWLHKLVSQFRVPSRASIFVHFSLLMITGLFLQKILVHFHSLPKKTTAIKLLFPLLIFLELPPVYTVPTAFVLPENKALNDIHCGGGMYFPYVNGGFGLSTYYHFLQTMRGSNCTILNAISWQAKTDPFIVNKFGLHQVTMKKIIREDQQFKDQVTNFVNCMSLEWIFFDNLVPLKWRQDICTRLGWKMSNEITCSDNFKNRPIVKKADQCL